MSNLILDSQIQMHNMSRDGGRPLMSGLRQKSGVNNSELENKLTSINGTNNSPDLMPFHAEADN